MNEITTHITKENIKFRKWLTSSDRPALIFSISLKSFKNSTYWLFWSKIDCYVRDIIWWCVIEYEITYSVIRTEKLVLPPATSYHPISCRINDSKYLVRMRVICRIAVRLKQSTQKMPKINCHNVAITDKIPYAIESFMIASRFSSIVASVLKWINGTHNLSIETCW